MHPAHDPVMAVMLPPGLSVTVVPPNGFQRVVIVVGKGQRRRRYAGGREAAAHSRPPPVGVIRVAQSSQRSVSHRGHMRIVVISIGNHQAIGKRDRSEPARGIVEVFSHAPCTGDADTRQLVRIVVAVVVGEAAELHRCAPARQVGGVLHGPVRRDFLGDEVERAGLGGVGSGR